MFDEPTRRASQGNLQGFGDALAGRGADLNQTIQVAPAALRPPRLGHGQPVRAAHRAALASSRSSGTPRASSRRSRRPTRTSSRRWPTPSRPSRATRRRSRSTISKSPPTLRAGTAVAARAAPVPRAHRGAVARPRHRRRPSCAARCRRSTRRCASARRCSGARSPLNDNLQGALGALEDLVKAPDHGRLAARPHGHRRHAAAPAALPRPVRHGLQLLEHLLDLRRRAPLGARRHRLLAARAAEHGHAGAGHRRHRLVGRQRVRPRQGRAAGQRRPVRPQQRLRARPSTRRATPTAAPARPATSRPTTRCATRASRATPTRAP